MIDKTSAPIINTLATEFAVFDNWFCSLPGPTDPNRAFAMSGTSAGVITNFNGTLWTQQSYFDLLRQHNRTFGGYYTKDLWALLYFEDTNRPENRRFIRELDEQFYSDVAAGSLAQFTWLQPQSSAHEDSQPNWQHPDASVIEGERMIKQVYEAVRAGPKWEETLLIITYDEHGGFYDHVPPPTEGVPAPDSNVASNGFTFNQLGVRIPTVAVSPFIPRGTVVHAGLEGEMPTPESQFEATSVIATAHKLLGLEAEGVPPLGDRMAWANTFAGLTELLPAARTDCPLTLPDLPSPAPESFALQRAKPLNEHLESQLLFFCVQSYPELHKAGNCPGRPDLLPTQGLASDWLRKETAKYLSNLATQEAQEKTEKKL
jgi:phospholipase C